MADASEWADEDENAPRTRKVCVAIKDDGTRCRCLALHFFDKCSAHGGRKRCVEKGCNEMTEGSRPFCPLHHGECIVEGCFAFKKYSNGGCEYHPGGHDNGTDAAHHEWVKRLRRDRKLRARWLKVLLDEQGGRCAKSVVTCKVVNNGQATSVCPWGDRELPPDAAQVDHIKPLWDGGSDGRRNLQVICACCHSIKSLAEARMRAGHRPR